MIYHIDDDIAAETKPFQSLTISTDQTELCQILFPQMELFSMFHLLARVLSHSSSFVAQLYLHYSEKSILKNSVYNGQSWGLLRIAHLMQSSELPTICNPEVGEHKNHLFAIFLPPLILILMLPSHCCRAFFLSFLFFPLSTFVHFVHLFLPAFSH